MQEYETETPERILWAAVFNKMFEDALCFVRNVRPDSDGNYKDAYNAFLMIYEHTEDFDIVCALAGLDAEYSRWIFLRKISNEYGLEDRIKAYNDGRKA